MDERMPGLGLANLVPPPGGERRLRAALRGRNTTARGWGIPLATAACLCALVASIFVPRPDPMDDGIRHAIEDAVAPTDGIRVADRRVERIASQDPGVRIYRVAMPPPSG